MDTKGLLKSLKDHDVDFVIIGATAFPVHGYARATLDIDIFIRPESENAKRTWSALNDFGFDLSEITIDDLLKKKLLIRQYIVEADFHPFVKGTSFEKIWGNKVEAEFGETKVFFASLNDLIEMKKASGRPQDLEDLKYLLKLKEKISGEKTNKD